MPFRPRRASFAALPLALLASCAADARRNYAEEVLDDVPGAPVDDDARVAQLARTTDAPVHSGLTLGQCMQLALANSDQLAARGERIVQADWSRAEAITRVLPRAGFVLLHAEFSDTLEVEGDTFLPRSTTVSALRAQQRVFDPGLISAYRVAAATRRLEGLRLDDARDELLFQVAGEFYEALSLESDITSYEASVASAAEELRVRRLGVDVGRVQEHEALLAEAQLRRFDVSLIQARFDLQRTRARLARLLGVAAPQRLVDTLRITPPAQDVEVLVASALERRPDLAAAREEVEVAAERRNLALSQLLPTVDLEFLYFTNHGEGFLEAVDWAFVGGLVWQPLDTRPFVQAARERSVERERALLAQDLEREIRLEVIEASLSYATIARSLDELEARNRAAAEAERLASEQYGAGQATNLDVLTAQSTHRDAEVDLARARYALKLAALRIQLATGELATSAPARSLFDAR